MSRSRSATTSRFGSFASSERLAAALIALAVALACFDDGGYSDESRQRFAFVALLAALAAWRADPARARRVAREPVVLVLLALAALGALSGAWTVGYAGAALSWAAAAAGLALLTFAAAVVARAGAAAAWIAVVTLGMALIGIYAAAIADPPLAHRAAGLWRPASTFQYSPALALLVVGALPPVLAAMCRAQRAWHIAGAGLAGSVAGVTLSLAESRTQLAFAALVALALLARPARLGTDRCRLLAALALVLAAGLGAYAAAGGYVPVTPPPDDEARLLALGIVLLAGTLAWLAARHALARGAPVALLVLALAGTGTVAAVAKPAPRIISSGVVLPGERAPRIVPPRDLDPIRDRLLHGRLDIWREAVEVFADRPLHGSGADSYLFVSDAKTFYAHSLPLELAAELGIAGLLLSLALYAAIAQALWRRRNAAALGLLGAAAVAFPAANLVDWPWHLAGTGAVWALALGALLSATRAPH